MNTGGWHNGTDEHAHGNRGARDPDGSLLRPRSKQNHAREQTQRSASERRDGDMSEAFHVHVRQIDVPQHQRAE